MGLKPGQGIVISIILLLTVVESQAQSNTIASRFETVPAYTQTFKENIQKAVADHPRTGAARAARDGQRTLEQEARSTLYPQVDAGLSGRHRLADSFENRFDNINIRSQRDSSANASITGRQLIIDGGQTLSRIASAKHAFTAAHEEYGLEASAVALNAVEFHYQVVFQRLRRELHQQNIDVHRDKLGKVRLRFESGRGPGRDVALIEARLALAEAEASNVQRDLETAISSYEEIYGFLPDNLKRPGLSLDIPDSVNDALELGFQNSRLLTLAASRSLSLKEDVGVTKAEMLPQLSLEVTATKYDLERNNDDFDVTGRLVMNYNLYNGGATTARISRSLKDYQRSRHDQDRAQREVNRAIKVAYQTMESQDRRVISLKKARDANQRNSAQMLEQFEATGGSLFALLEAEKDYHQARELYLGSMIERDITRYRLLDAMGTLLPALNIRLKRE